MKGLRVALKSRTQKMKWDKETSESYRTAMAKNPGIPLTGLT